MHFRILRMLPSALRIQQIKIAFSSDFEKIVDEYHRKNILKRNQSQRSKFLRLQKDCITIHANGLGSLRSSYDRLRMEKNILRLCYDCKVLANFRSMFLKFVNVEDLLRPSASASDCLTIGICNLCEIILNVTRIDIRKHIRHSVTVVLDSQIICNRPICDNCAIVG